MVYYEKFSGRPIGLEVLSQLSISYVTILNALNAVRTSVLVCDASLTASHLLARMQSNEACLPLCKCERMKLVWMKFLS